MKIVLKNLTKKFPGPIRRAREEVVAVNDFDFEIPDGQLVSLLGPSGCGKSILSLPLRSVLCYLSPDWKSVHHQLPVPVFPVQK